MRIYNKAFLVALVVALFGVVGAASAQDSAVNAYSPYTMYGIGELGVNGNAINRTMGGAGIAFRSTQMANLLNPAGYSATLRNSFIFEVGMEGNFLKNTQRKYTSTDISDYTTAANAKNTANLRESAIQFPVAKGLGFGFSLTPYGSVGYKMHALEQNEDTWGTVGAVMYNYQGDGDVTEIKAGLGWEFVRGVSIGIAAKYYWGNILHNYTTSIYGDYVGSGDYVSTKGLDDYAISNFKFQVGLQANLIATKKRMLTIGATYDYGGPLNPKVTQTIYIGDYASSVVFKEDSRGQMRLPHSVGAGICYQDSKFIVMADYEYQNWGGDNAFIQTDSHTGMSVKYVDTNTYKFGFEYIPNRFDVRNYFKRVSYRIGARYGNYYQSYEGRNIDQWAVTAGFGFPLRFMAAHSINVGVEVGGRGNHESVVMPKLNQRIGLIRQNYVKLQLGFSLFGEDYWFVRPKID